MLLAGPSWATASAGREAFKKGVEAIDLGHLDDAVEHLRRAVREDGRETDERIFLSGVFSRPYLPHFFLGWALYKAGNDHCEEALLAFQESLRQGVVRGFDRLLQDLDEGRDKCGALLLPSASAEASRELERATRLEARAETPFSDEQLDAERRRLTQDWSAARSRLEQARSGSDPIALAKASRNLSDLSDAVERLVRRAEAQTSETQAANAFSAASGEARDAIAEAERRQRQLDALLVEPRHGEARRRRVESGYSQAAFALAAVRSRLARSTTADEVRILEGEADTLAERFSDLVVQAAAVRAEEPRESEAIEVGAQGAAPPQRTSTPPPASQQTSNAPRADAATVAEVRRRVAAADLMLREVATVKDSRLAETQRQRLTSLVAQAVTWLTEPDPARLDELPARIRASCDALRLIVGTERYFEGQPRAAVELLEAIEDIDGRVGAAALLVRAAGHYDLYRLGGELDAERLRRASGDARSCHVLDPVLRPGAQRFSPAFREFFEQAVAESAVASATASNQNR